MKAVKILRFVLVGFNFAFWLSGLIFIIAGIWTNIELAKYTDNCAALSKLATLLLICTGVMILCFGSLGCCCTLKTDPVMFYWYNGLMAVIFILEIAVVVTIFTCKNCLIVSNENSLKLSANLNNYQILVTNFNDFDASHSKYNCCGITGSGDWIKLNPPMEIPQSCCIKENCNVNDFGSVYEEGCLPKVNHIMLSNMSIIGILSIVMSILPIIGALVTRFFHAVLEKSQYERI